MILSVIIAYFAIFGICLVFHVPIRHAPAAAAIGAIAYVIQQLCINSGLSEVTSCFFASCGVCLLSYVASRLFKEAATIFIIPGILCLVPGAMIYQTMYAFVGNELNEAARAGTHTLFQAGAIALGLLVMGGIISTVMAIFRKASHMGTGTKT